MRGDCPSRNLYGFLTWGGVGASRRAPTSFLTRAEDEALFSLITHHFQLITTNHGAGGSARRHARVSTGSDNRSDTLSTRMTPFLVLLRKLTTIFVGAPHKVWVMGAIVSQSSVGSSNKKVLLTVFTLRYRQRDEQIRRGDGRLQVCRQREDIPRVKLVVGQFHHLFKQRILIRAALKVVIAPRGLATFAPVLCQIAGLPFARHARIRA